MPKSQKGRHVRVLTDMRKWRKMTWRIGGVASDCANETEAFTSGRYWARTSDLLLVEQALSQLS
jgi:hypothetical protein